jgi:RNA polymerase sigma-70 factor (family 1)
MDYKLLSDDILVKLLKVDDESAFKEIYTKYWKRLFSAAFHRLGSKEISKEIVQNIFLNIWEKRNSLSINNLENYLQTSIKNRVVNYIESTVVQRKYQQHMLKNFAPNSLETEATLQYNELYLALEKALILLPPKTRDIFKMSRFEKLSIKEIALHFGISEKAVEYHITSSLKILRVSLKEYMLSAFIFVAVMGL